MSHWLSRFLFFLGPARATTFPRPMLCVKGMEAFAGDGTNSETRKKGALRLLKGSRHRDI